MKQNSFSGFSTFDYQILVINLYLLLLAIICSITESNPQIRTVQMPTHCNEQTKTEHHPESLKGMGQGGNSLKLLYVSCYRPAWHKYSCTPTGSVYSRFYLVVPQTYHPYFTRPSFFFQVQSSQSPASGVRPT